MKEYPCRECGHPFTDHHDGFCDNLLCQCTRFRGEEPDESELRKHKKPGKKSFVEKQREEFGTEPYVLGQDKEEERDAS